MNTRSNRPDGVLPSIQPVSSIVEKMIRSFGISRSYYGWKAVMLWPEVVGETIARIAKAVRFEDGILYVSVPDAVWRQELTMQIESILSKIQSMPHGHVVKKIHLYGNEKG